MEGQDLEGCWERAWRPDSPIWTSSVLCELCYETKEEENTWNAEAGVGGGDVAACKVWARLAELLGDQQPLPEGPVHHGSGMPRDLGQSWLWMARNAGASSLSAHGAGLQHPGGTDLLQASSRVNPCLGCVGFAAHAQAGPPPLPGVDRAVFEHLKIYKMCLGGWGRAGSS